MSIPLRLSRNWGKLHPKDFHRWGTRISPSRSVMAMRDGKSIHRLTGLWSPRVRNPSHHPSLSNSEMVAGWLFLSALPCWCKTSCCSKNTEKKLPLAISFQSGSYLFKEGSSFKIPRSEYQLEIPHSGLSR